MDTSFMTRMEMTEDCKTDLKEMVEKLTEDINTHSISSSDDFDAMKGMRDMIAAEYGAVIGLKHRIFPAIVVFELKRILTDYPVRKDYLKGEH